MTSTNKTLKTVFLCLAALAVMAGANCVAGNAPFSTSIFVGLLYAGAPPIWLGISYILSFAVYGSAIFWGIGGAAALVLGGIFFIYSKKRKKPKAELIVYFAVALLPYILIGGFTLEKLAYSAIICLFSFIVAHGAAAVRAVTKRAKPSGYELACLAVAFVGAFVGFVRLYGEEIYLAVAVATLLLLERLGKSGESAAVAGIIAFPLAISTGNYEFFCTTFLWFAFSEIFVKRSRTMAALGLIAAEAVSAFIFGYYLAYTPFRAAAITIPALIFAVLPAKLFEEIKLRLTFSGKELLVKNFVNRSRVILSSRLYEMSGVFFQMKSALSDLKAAAANENDIVERILNDSVSAVCHECPTFDRCAYKDYPPRDALDRLIRLGIQKGRITLVDVPRELIDECGAMNSFVFEINRLIAAHSEYLHTFDGKRQSKELVSLAAEGLGKVMKGLAYETSKTLAPEKHLETVVADCMRRYGFPFYGAMVLGDDGGSEISVFTEVAATNGNKLAERLSEAVGFDLTVTEVTPFSDNLVGVTLTRSPEFDAVFGVSSVTKNGSPVCGDTHSLVKIDEGKFLVALSDGMGSGDRARLTSSTSLSLIESFYRAGLDSELILSTVNKVLSMSVEDNFAAVDVGVVDLRRAKSDFIKIGAPYGFVVSENGVKFIEGSSLPLGILDELTPGTASSAISAGDVIVLLSDGVTDAFGSSSDMVEFLKSAPILNPQALSDSIVKRALDLSGGSARDDMTALCVRIVDRLAS